MNPSPLDMALDCKQRSMRATGFCPARFILSSTFIKQMEIFDSIPSNPRCVIANKLLGIPFTVVPSADLWITSVDHQ